VSLPNRLVRRVGNYEMISACSVGAGWYRLDSRKQASRLMPHIRFTQNIQRHVPCPARTVDGASLREALECYFRGNPMARGYVLDDQGALRKHMAIFINGEPVLDRSGLADAVPEDGTIDILQALSGG
jgi:molybdopterin synthase sulfur carrier subunit